MKKSLVVALMGAAITTPIVVSAKSCNYHSYVGIEAIQTNLNFKSGYGNGVFKKNPQDYSAFVGFNFYKFLGLELGYEYQPSKSKDATLTTGQSLPGGATLQAGNFVVTSASYKGSHPYVGLFAETSTQGWRTKFIFQGLIGASVSHFNMRENIINNNVGLANSNFSFKKTKVVPMVKLSGIGCITHNFGVRLSLNYRNTASFTIPANVGTEVVKLKDTWGIGLGLLYIF